MKVNYEVELKTTGFVRVDVPDGLEDDEIEEYITDNLTAEDISYELRSGMFSDETYQEVEVLQHSGYIDTED